MLLKLNSFRLVIAFIKNISQEWDWCLKKLFFDFISCTLFYFLTADSNCVERYLCRTKAPSRLDLIVSIFLWIKSSLKSFIKHRKLAVNSMKYFWIEKILWISLMVFFLNVSFQDMLKDYLRQLYYIIYLQKDS